MGCGKMCKVAGCVYVNEWMSKGFGKGSYLKGLGI